MDYAEAQELVLELAFERGDVDNLLEKSKGERAGDEIYRPYFVAAVLWRTSKKRRILSGLDAKLESVDELIAGLLAQQRLEDLGVTVPEGFEASERSVDTTPAFIGSSSVPLIRTF